MEPDESQEKAIEFVVAAVFHAARIVACGLHEANMTKSFDEARQFMAEAKKRELTLPE